MPLSDLKSAYSFYEKVPPGFKPNTSVEQTDFKLNANGTISTNANGYSNKGSAVSYNQITTKDSFTIAGQGNASRINQLGSGTKFPIGPKGQTHTFDITRTGFNTSNRYEDVYNNLSLAGLADTYTANSPIDDMYNRFNVREDAFNLMPYAKEPYILRGIQRDGSSDPQRYSISGMPSAEIPRGGVITSVQRIALDAVRIGKFLIKPSGLLFLGKQSLLGLQNPDQETRLGANKPILTKLAYNPASLLSQSFIRIPRLFNVQGVQIRYSDNVGARNDEESTKFNRLAKGDSNFKLTTEFNTAPESYVAQRTIDDIDVNLKTQINDESFESKIFKPAPGLGKDLPNGYGTGTSKIDRYRSITSYSVTRDRAKTRSNSKVDIDFLTGERFTDVQQEYNKNVHSGELVELKIGSTKFKAYISSLSDGVEANWSGEQDQGRADQRYMYTGYQRDISLGFMVAVEKSTEINSLWNKLSALARKAYPTYNTSVGYYANRTSLTLGGLYKGMPVILTSISYDWDTETPWALPASTTEYPYNMRSITSTETTVGNSKPLYTNVQCEFIYIGSGLTDSSTPFFATNSSDIVFTDQPISVEDQDDFEGQGVA